MKDFLKNNQIQENISDTNVDFRTSKELSPIFLVTDLFECIPLAGLLETTNDAVLNLRLGIELQSADSPAAIKANMQTDIILHLNQFLLRLNEWYQQQLLRNVNT